MSSDTSAILALPYLQPAQAQKHVTHNEALRVLDVLVQLGVASRSLAAPPALPAEGTRHIVAAPASGEWAGEENRLAAWLDGGWAFFTPLPGWRAEVLDEGIAVIWDGSAWSPEGLATSLPLLGINAAADATNRLAVASDAVLLSHDGAGHQLKINKASAGETASLLFQTGYSGRAEMGLAGSDDFAVKVSADGAAWSTAFSVAAGSGAMDVAPGLTVGGEGIWHRGSLLGSVALTGGVPTGAVIEQGSDANGDYVKFADGSMVCTSVAIDSGAVTTALGALWQSGALSWSFPAAFVSAPAVSGGAGAADRWCGIEAPTATAVDFRVIGAVSGGGGSSVRLVAVGRWA